jgi:hypothetical protein
MLAVNVDQQIAEHAQLLDRHRPAVNPNAGPPRRVDDAAQEALLVIGKLVFFEKLLCRNTFRDHELRADFSLGATLPYQIGTGPLAENRREGIDHDRFARTGFSGQSGEAPVEFQGKVLDENEVSNIQSAKHGLEKKRFGIENDYSVSLQWSFSLSIW